MHVGIEVDGSRCGAASARQVPVHRLRRAVRAGEILRTHVHFADPLGG